MRCCILAQELDQVVPQLSTDHAGTPPTPLPPATFFFAPQFLSSLTSLEKRSPTVPTVNEDARGASSKAAARFVQLQNQIGLPGKGDDLHLARLLEFIDQFFLERM